MCKEEERKGKGGVERFLVFYQLGRSRVLVVGQVIRECRITKVLNHTNSFNSFYI